MASAVLSRLFRDYLTRLRLGATLQHALRAAADPALGAQEMARVFDGNQAYLQWLLRIEPLQKRITEWAQEEAMSKDRRETVLKRALALLGKSAVRNVVATLSLNRIAGAGLPKTEAEKLLVVPRESVKLALEAEEYCENRKIPGAHFAYEAGLHYDAWLAILNARKELAEAKGVFEETWKHSLRVAHFAQELAVYPKAFPHTEQCFAAGLLLNSGKLVLATLYPKSAKNSWTAFAASVVGQDPLLDDSLRLVRERKLFELTHPEASFLVARSSGYFTTVAPALQFYPEPYFLKKTNPGLYLLATLLLAAQRLARLKSPKDPPPLGPREKRELQRFGIGDKELELIVQRVLK